MILENGYGSSDLRDIRDVSSPRTTEEDRHDPRGVQLRVEIDGCVKTATLPNGNVLTVDSRQYLVVKPHGILVLETPDVHRVLGNIMDFRNYDFVDTYFSDDKLNLIQIGIGKLLYHLGMLDG